MVCRDQLLELTMQLLDDGRRHPAVAEAHEPASAGQDAACGQHAPGIEPEAPRQIARTDALAAVVGYQCEDSGLQGF